MVSAERRETMVVVMLLSRRVFGVVMYFFLIETYCCELLRKVARDPHAYMSACFRELQSCVCKLTVHTTDTTPTTLAIACLRLLSVGGQ